LKNQPHFTDTKLALFDVLDAARDVQLKVESAQYRIENTVGKINRYIGKRPIWMWNNKYAAQAVTNCENDRATGEGELEKLATVYHKFYAQMVPHLVSETARILKSEHDKIVRLIAANKKT